MIVELLGCQVVVLGSGAIDFEEKVAMLREDYPNHVRGLVSFNIPLAHQLMAAADILLIPSRYEPCGLTQMQAMRYGTVPVVAATGGLRDSIEAVRPSFHHPAQDGSLPSFHHPAAAKEVSMQHRAGLRDERSGSGFAFWPPTASNLFASISSAVQLYRCDRESWRDLQRRGMSRDSSWDRSALQYESVFQGLVGKLDQH